MKKLLVFILLLPISIAFAQEDQSSSYLYQELRQYALKNIRPVLQKQRGQLDRSLSTEEKERINDLRAEIREVMLASQEEAFQIASGLYPNENSILDIFFPFFEENEGLIKEIFTDAWEIAQQHETTIESLLQEIKDQSNQWKKDINRIIASYKKEGVQENSDVVTKKVYERHFGSIVAPAFFLLWSPEGILFDFGQDNFLKESFANSRLSPNPVTDYVTIYFELMQPSNVVLGLYDMRGNSLKTLENYYDQVGSMEERFDLVGMGSGGYFVRIATRWDSATLRFEKK